jgi:transposase
MVMGKRKRRQQEMWLATNDLPKSPGHPFYQRLNAALEEAGFDRFAEESCDSVGLAIQGPPDACSVLERFV